MDTQRTPLDNRHPIRRGLLALRLTLGASLLFWGIIALQGPARGKLLFADLPGVDVTGQAAVFMAVGEITLGAFVAMGLLRGWSYGLAFFCCAVAVFASHGALLHPLEGMNALYTATIPALVSFGVLFALRSEDRLFAADSILAARAMAHPAIPRPFPEVAPSVLKHVPAHEVVLEESD